MAHETALVCVCVGWVRTCTYLSQQVNTNYNYTRDVQRRTGDDISAGAELLPASIHPHPPMHIHPSTHPHHTHWSVERRICLFTIGLPQLLVLASWFCGLPSVSMSSITVCTSHMRGIWDHCNTTVKIQNTFFVFFVFDLVSWLSKVSRCKA